MENYYLYYTSTNEMYVEINETTMGRKFYETAMQLTNSQQEAQLVKYNICNCGDV